MVDLVALKADIDLHIAGTDPDWNGIFTALSTDEEINTAYNAFTQTAQISIEAALKFLLLDNVHSTDGTDTQDRAIWTRMKDVDALAVTPAGAVDNPWGSTAVGTVTEIQQIKTSQLLDFFTLSAQGGLPVDLEDTNFKVYLAGAEAAGCMSTTQETALLALGNNLQTRSTEIGLGKVRVGNVEAARAL